MSVECSKIKAGDWVQIAHGDWFEVTKPCGIDGEVAVQTNVRHTWIWPNLITAHRASEPAPVERDPMCDAEWEHLFHYGISEELLNKE